VALVRHDSAERELGKRGHLIGQGHRVTQALDAGPAHAHVDVDDNARGRSGGPEGSCERPGCGRRVDRDRDRAARSRARECPEPGRIEDDVREQHVGADLRGRGDLVGRRAREPLRAGGELHARDRRALVVLQVRAQARLAAAEKRRHPLDVPLEHVQVDHEEGRGLPLEAGGRRKVSEPGG
jgi:hypothetical protein